MMLAKIDGPDYMKVPDVMKALNVGRTFVYGLMDRGELSYARIGRCRRVLRTSVEELLRRSTVPSR